MKNLVIIIGLYLIYCLIIYYNQHFIFTEDFYYASLSDKLGVEQIRNFIKFSNNSNFLVYLIVIPTILFRSTFTLVCLKTGSLISECFKQVSFWRICIQSEIIFAVGAVAGLLYTEFFVDVETLEQLSVNPFSLQVFVSDSVPKWSSYFFNTLNLFEFGYVLVLAYLIAEETKSKVLPSLRFVASTYLPGLALWVLLVSYLSVVFQP